MDGERSYNILKRGGSEGPLFIAKKEVG